jgi:hypothetical protein
VTEHPHSSPDSPPHNPHARPVTDDEAARGPYGRPTTTPLPQGRYSTADRPRFSRTAQTWTISIVLAVIVAAIGWITMGPDAVTIRGKNVGFLVEGPESVQITFDVAKPQEATVVCTLDALSENYAQVGTKNVTIGPSDVTEARFTTVIATTEIAVTAIVVGCTLVT